MGKKILSVVLVLFNFSVLFAAEIKIAPVAVYDARGNKTAAPFDPAEKLYKELEKYWFEGLISFSLAPENKYGIPLTIIDANKICAAENSDYLIYGYIKKYEKNWSCEIKLYDAQNKKVVQDFFAADSIEHYDRFMNALCRNVLSGIENISGLNTEVLREKDTRPVKLYIPVSLSYWTPVDSDWGSKIMGIADLNAGIEYYPPLPLLVKGGNAIDFSARLNLSWNIGINKNDAYPLLINTVSFSLPLFAHVHFDARHSLYGGAGFAYSIEFMKIQPKYQDEKLFYQNVFSVEASAGYGFNVNEKWTLFAEIAFDFHLHGDGFVSVKPTLGASFNISNHPISDNSGGENEIY